MQCSTCLGSSRRADLFWRPRITTSRGGTRISLLLGRLEDQLPFARVTAEHWTFHHPLKHRRSPKAGQLRYLVRGRRGTARKEPLSAWRTDSRSVAEVISATVIKPTTFVIRKGRREGGREREGWYLVSQFHYKRGPRRYHKGQKRKQKGTCRLTLK